MRKLLNTLYILEEDVYLSLDGENISVIKPDGTEVNLPLCNLEEIVCFNYRGCSPAFMGKCVAMHIALSFIAPSGKFLAKVVGETKGNVFLRIQQIECFRDSDKNLNLIRNCIISKILNMKYLVSRSIRDYDEIKYNKNVIALMNKAAVYIDKTISEKDIDILRGIEGDIAKDYFSIFNLFIRNNDFTFTGRSRQPPLDRVNALLSFVYTMQVNSIAAALESVGLDAYIGFYHTLRPGRASLALDIVEEFRAFVERFIISIINLRQVDKNDFEEKLGGAILLNDKGRRKILKLWQEKKKAVLMHPVLKQKVEYGIVPFIQATLLAKHIRGEIGDYYPMLLK